MKCFHFDIHAQGPAAAHQVPEHLCQKQEIDSEGIWLGASTLVALYVVLFIPHFKHRVYHLLKNRGLINE